MTLSGPDASRHQGAVNWTAVRGAGHSYGIIKATEGTSYAYENWYHDNIGPLRASGLVPGAYHFLRSDRDPIAQADYFIAAVGSFEGMLAVVDVETGSNNSRPTGAQAETFANRFRARTGGHPILCYTGRWYWRDTIGNPQNGPKVGPLWHSEYDQPGADVANGPEQDVYGGWGGCLMWQWTSSGTCPGIAGNCDLNLFYGDQDALLALTTAGGDMPLTDEDKKWLRAAMDNSADESGKRQTMFIMDGRTNSVYNPAVKGNEWMNGAIDNREVLTKVNEAVAASQKTILAAIAALPTGPGGTLSKADVLEVVTSGPAKATYVAASKQAGFEGCSDAAGP